MTLLPFPEWKPDISDRDAASTQFVQNVLPRGDGYGAMAAFVIFTAALAAACRGFFVSRQSDGSVAIFAGTSTKLYKLNNSDFTWTDVSLGSGTYSALTSSDQWQFAQFNNFVFATQANAVVQVYDLTSSTNFANLAGTPPQARYIAVVGRFLVLSGLLSNVYRIQWSGLNATTTWTSGTNQSDFQDLADGGIVRGVAGGEFGVIFQDASIRRMTYAPGSPVIFQIDRISESDGLHSPLSLIRAGDRVFFYSPQGFKVLLPGGYPTPIGKEKVDRTFAADLDTGNLQLFIGSSDPASTRVFWAYKSLAGQTGLFDKILCYDWALDKFTTISMSGEYLAPLSRPGLTLENLDAIAPTPITITGAASNGGPNLIRLTVASTSTLTTGQIKAVTTVVGTTEANGNWTITVIDATHVDLQGSVFTNVYVSGGIIGGSLDALTFSLDDISTGTFPQIASVSSAHKLGFFTGSNLEATLDTATQDLGDGRRMFVKGLRPISDAPTAYGSLFTASTLSATEVQTSETLINANGVCPQRRSTRYARGRLRIPAGTSWTFATGVEPDAKPEGMR